MNQSLLILIFDFLTHLTDLPILSHNFPFLVPVTSWHTNGPGTLFYNSVNGSDDNSIGYNLS